MCEICGCNTPNNESTPDKHAAHKVHAHVDQSGNVYYHSHEHHSDGHSHDEISVVQSATVVIQAGTSILQYNQLVADQIRTKLRQNGTLAINLMSAPGSGKTTLLEKTLASLHPNIFCGVIVGDLSTQRDAERLRKTGAPVIQITTGTACHLDALMVMNAMQQLPMDRIQLLFIENVGNLVCPASFDLGENIRVVLLSVTEGEDKPLKYPPIFNNADLVILTKTDLSEATGFDIQAAKSNIFAVAPKARIMQLSARTGAGMNQWLDFLRSLIPLRSS